MTEGDNDTPVLVDAVTFDNTTGPTHPPQANSKTGKHKQNASSKSTDIAQKGHARGGSSAQAAPVRHTPNRS
jgi:hypothetical protein